MRILYIDLDALRPDHLGCYGYHRNTSPHIDRLSAESTRFTNIYVSDAPCLPSRTAFYSGRFGIQTGVVGHGGTASEPKIQGPDRTFTDRFTGEGLPGQLQKLGFRTTVISSFGQRHAAHWFYAGFNEVHNTGLRGMDSAEEVEPTITKWLADHAATDKWYLHINLWDAHTPYRVPAEFGDPFQSDPLPKWLDDEDLIARHNQMVGPHTSMEIGMYDDKEYPKYPRHLGKVTDRASMRKLIDGYDTAIIYADAVIGRIVDQLKAAGVYDDTAIIISSDHGENFGELGIYAEHATADEGTCHIPLIVKWPGQKPKVADGLHYHLDWAPTLMDLLGGKQQPSWDGTSFVESIRSESAAGREELVISQCAHVCQRSVRWADWLYIRTYHDGFRLFPEEMLWDLAVDPHEQADLAVDRPEICREGAERLKAWHHQQMQKIATFFPNNSIDPMQTVLNEGGPAHAPHQGPVSPLPAYLKRLEATGRAEGAARLRAKYVDYLKG